MADSQEERGKLPGSFYNTLSMMGAGIAAVSFACILFFFLVDFFAETTMPYLGILTYLVFPVFLVLGLVLVPIGMWCEHRRRSGSATAPALLHIDFNLPRHRRMAAVVGIVTTIFLLFTAVGSYK